MSSILTITAKGNSKTEIDKNLNQISFYMNSQQAVFELISSTNPNYNPRIYYSKENVISKTIHEITTKLKTDKIINHAIREIAYSGNLNKV
jgi:hypothetical protein